MTRQFTDMVRYQDRDWLLVGVRGESPFDADAFGLQLTPVSSALWRGQLVTYQITDDRLRVSTVLVSRQARWHGEPRIAGAEMFGVAVSPVAGLLFRGCVELELDRPTEMTGGLLIAHTPTPERQPNMGFPSVCYYETVLDLQLDSGRVSAVVDRSAHMAGLRRAIVAGEVPPPDGDASDESWIERTFTLDYSRGGL